MSITLDNFEALIDDQEDLLGERVTASVGDVSNKDAIPTSLEGDLIPVEGGTADGGGFSLMMRVSDFETPPENFAAVQITGRTDTNLVVLRISETGGVYTLAVGDPAANQ